MMTDGVQNKLNKSEVIFILTSLVSLTAAIRVDWNTNTGPIVPPTSTVKPVPKPPYKDPAPVWENQYDDQINPNTYRYLLPPPSRPKFLTDNYARAPISPQDEYRYQYEKSRPNYGHIITALSMNDLGLYNRVKTVPTLAVYYVPNVGLKYNAVVPSFSTTGSSSSADTTKSHYLKENNIYDDDYNNNNKYKMKLNGKYNHKLKKYKAYEKMKYLPYVYYIKPVVKDQSNKYTNQQQLPYPSQGPPFAVFGDKISTTQQPSFDVTSTNNINLESNNNFISKNKYTKNIQMTQNDFNTETKKDQSSLMHKGQNQWDIYKNNLSNDLSNSPKPER